MIITLTPYQTDRLRQLSWNPDYSPRERSDLTPAEQTELDRLERLSRQEYELRAAIMRGFHPYADPDDVPRCVGGFQSDAFDGFSNSAW